MTELPSNPVDALLTILGIGPTDNRWNLPQVREWRAYCEELVRVPSEAETATFTEDEVNASRPMPVPPTVPAPEPVEDEGVRMERLADLNRQKGRLL